MEKSGNYSREGYLNENFRLFHLKDTAGQERDFHYHEFDKIVIFLGGNADYVIEGVSYPLKPLDILLVSHHLVHKAIIDTNVPYERVIIYLNTAFVEAQSAESESLMRCFKAAEKRGFYLMRAEGDMLNETQQLLEKLEAALSSEEYGKEAEARALFLLFLVQLNRIMICDDTDKDDTAFRYDTKIAAVLSYINDNIGDELTVDKLCAKAYMSKYHFMRRFKECTGYTVHNYIRQKRMMLAAELIRSGMPKMQAAEKCGFSDYSAFLRAFKKMFNTIPGKFK